MVADASIQLQSKKNHESFNGWGKGAQEKPEPVSRHRRSQRDWRRRKEGEREITSCKGKESG